MTNEERDTHLIFLRMMGPHFEKSGPNVYFADGYTLRLNDDKWELLAPCGQVLLAEPDWADIAVRCGFSVGPFASVQSIVICSEMAAIMREIEKRVASEQNN